MIVIAPYHCCCCFGSRCVREMLQNAEAESARQREATCEEPNAGNHGKIISDVDVIDRANNPPITTCTLIGTFTTFTLTRQPPLLRQIGRAAAEDQGRVSGPIDAPTNHTPASSPSIIIITLLQPKHSATMDDHFERMLEPSRYVTCTCVPLLLSPCAWPPCLLLRLIRPTLFCHHALPFPPPWPHHCASLSFLLAATARPSRRTN